MKPEIFAHQSSIYRDFDIRGKYPEEITDEEVFKIACALTKHFDVKKVAIGHDIRPSANALKQALTDGFIKSGVQVYDLGLSTTPMSYFIAGSTDVDMTVMITASHMPSEYNGLKITVDDAKPVTADILKIIRDIVGTHTFSEASIHGEVISKAHQADWIEHFKSKHDLKDSNLTVVIDPANMIGVLEIDTFKAFEPDITVHTIFDSFDHTCPNHEANPIKHETLTSLCEEVLCHKADIGIAFDGDADRVGFVDENGTPVRSDLIGALLARKVLQRYPNATIVCDLRCSRDVVNAITSLGGTVVREKVGHTNIRSRMRKEEAVLGIELSGHYFFKDSFYSEGGPLPAFLILELLHETKQPLSALVRDITTHYHSGEINSTVSRPVAEIYNDICSEFPDTSVSRLDGLSLESKTWWCNIRPSANDPLARLNIESETDDEMKAKRDTLLSIIRD